MKESILKATILSQAIPYIQKYREKIVVVKYGGNAMIEEELIHNVIRDVCLMNLVGIKVVLVHGGGPEINKALEKQNIGSKFIQGLRYTNQETMDVVQEVLAGKINKNLVKRIQSEGNKSIGLTGIDNMLLEVTQSYDNLGYVGKGIVVHNELLLDVLEKGYIPVVASIGMDKQGFSYNINADNVASAIASSLHAENLLIVSNIPGLLKDKNDEQSLISQIYIEEIEGYIKKGIISDGMIPKVNCLKQAVLNGVNKAVIIDGRISHSIIIEILSDEGSGTLFLKKRVNI